jgi:hypothetical protein
MIKLRTLSLGDYPGLSLRAPVSIVHPNRVEGKLREEEEYDELEKKHTCQEKETMRRILP